MKCRQVDCFSQHLCHSSSIGMYFFIINLKLEICKSSHPFLYCSYSIKQLKDETKTNVTFQANSQRPSRQGERNAQKNYSVYQKR